MRKTTSGILWLLLLTITPLATAPFSSAVAQDLALAGRRPRFLYAPSLRSTPVQIDAGRNSMLRRLVSLTLDVPTVAGLLGAIERQTGVKFLYDANRLRGDRAIPLRAESITVAAALTEILLGTGLDVVVSAGNRAALMDVASVSPVSQTGIVAGRVTDAKTGSGVSGVDVALEGVRWRATSDAEGRYRLLDVAPGNYTVLARRIGYRPERRAVTVTGGREVPVDVALQPAATQLGDVVVTAQKREERLQDVPLSIAVVTTAEIDRRGLVSAEDYLRGIPGVNQVEGALGGGSINIRGIETNVEYQNSRSGTTVATYFGETPTTNSAGVNASANVDLKLVDIERVEVLRGPQGTAFGNSSLGGAVRTIPVAPKLDRVEGKLAAGYSATSGSGGDNYNFQAVANVPLFKDKLALRATGFRYEESGFYRNVAGSDPTIRSALAGLGGAAFVADAEEVGASRFTGGRIAALFRASDALRVTLTYLTQKTELDGFAIATTGTYDQTRVQVGPEHVFRGQKGGLSDMDIDLANAMMEYDLGWANLLATYSYVESGSKYTVNNSFPPLWLPSSSLGGSDHREHVGEIRLTTHLDGAWNFLGGLYAEDLEDEGYYDYIWYGSPEAGEAFFGTTDRLVGLYLDRRHLTQKAAFAEASWEVLPRLTLTGGARAFAYDRTGEVESSGIFGVGDVRPVGAEASGTSFRGNLSHKLSDNALVYAGWAQGFRLGRAQPGLPPGLCDLDSDGIVDGGSNVTIESTRRVDSDEVDNYELGGKFTLLDRRLMIAADVYRIDWSGLPVYTSAPGQLCNLGYVANLGAARSEGIEFQANVYVTEAFRVDVGGSWIRAQLTEDVPLQGWHAGDRLPGSAEVNANFGLHYEFTIGGSTASVRTDGIYIGPFYGNMGEPVETKAADYVKVDASARVALRKTNIDLFVRNLTNADDFTFRGSYNPSGTDVFGYRLRPRTVGLQLSRTF